MEYPKIYDLLLSWKVNFKNIPMHSQCAPLKYAIILFINRNSLVPLLYSASYRCKGYKCLAYRQRCLFVDTSF